MPRGSWSRPWRLPRSRCGPVRTGAPSRFAACALAITLAPALPLSISLATTESERMVYIPTAFAAIITVLTIDALSRHRAVTATLVGLLIAAHLVLLQR